MAPAHTSSADRHDTSSLPGAVPLVAAHPSTTAQESAIDPVAAFAYLRRLPGMDDAAIGQALKELLAHTEQQGGALAGVFFEERVGDRLRVWCELIAACRSEGVATVVVPSSEHFHRDTELAAFMRAELATTIHGTVLLTTESGAAANETAPPEAGSHGH